MSILTNLKKRMIINKKEINMEIKAKKSLGQNFLKDEQVLQKILICLQMLALLIQEK